MEANFMGVRASITAVTSHYHLLAISIEGSVFICQSRWRAHDANLPGRRHIRRHCLHLAALEFKT